MKIEYFNAKYAKTELPDLIGDVKSSLSPARNEVVKAIANYCIEIRRRHKRSENIKVCISYVPTFSQCQQYKWPTFVITQTCSNSHIFEAVNERLPRKFRNKRFCVSAVGISNYLYLET